jgi:hypothetical protein
MVGQVRSTFEYDRARLIDTVSRTARQAMADYDHEEEARRVADSLQTAVAGTALAEVGAVGLGTLVTVLATTAAADVTGIVAAGTVAVLGLFVIPTRRRQLKQEFHEKIVSVRQRLMAVLTSQFDRELNRSVNEIERAISPYTRFIRAERKHMEDTRRDLMQVKDELERLKAAVTQVD